MFRTFPVALLTAVSLGVALPQTAHATICVVDAEEALNNTTEGKAAQKRLEAMYSAKQDELEKMQADLLKALESFESSKMILSDAARATKEEELRKQQLGLQQKVMGAEQEMQETYQQLLGGMEEKMLKAAEAVGAKRTCTVVLQKAAVLYAGKDAVDITKDIIAALDATP